MGNITSHKKTGGEGQRRMPLSTQVSLYAAVFVLIMMISSSLIGGRGSITGYVPGAILDAQVLNVTVKDSESFTV